MSTRKTVAPLWRDGVRVPVGTDVTPTANELKYFARVFAPIEPAPIAPAPTPEVDDADEAERPAARARRKA
ncbi:hypothetical protein [Methylobacterium ajmalii]|uniref:hypothetical protein n=1 Tax=Methylobacterium ajmalii TaxID=2738439 RepID=UPI002F352D62